MSSVSFQSPFCNTRLLWGVSFLLSEKPMVPQDRSGPCSLYSTTSWHIPPCHGLLTGNFRKNSYYIQDKSLLGCTSVDLVSVASFHLLMLTTKVKTRETRETKTRDSWSWTGVQKRVMGWKGRGARENMETYKHFFSVCLHHICKHCIGLSRTCGQAQSKNRRGIQSYKAKNLDTERLLVEAYYCNQSTTESESRNVWSRSQGEQN